MSSLTLPHATSSTPNASSSAPTSTPRASVLQRMSALVGAEIKLFFRNRTVLLNALLLSPLMTLALAPLMLEQVGAEHFSVFLMQMLLGFGAMFIIYYNVTTIAVARRESGFFQRMNTGQASVWEALIAAMIPSATTLALQVVTGMIAIAALGQIMPLLNPLALLVAVCGVVVVFAALGAWTSSWSASVESAQYSSLPIILAAMFFSGLVLPVQFMPETLQTICSYTPLYAANSLVGISMGVAPIAEGGAALNLADTFSAMAHPSLVLLAWSAVAIYLARYTRFARRA